MMQFYKKRDFGTFISDSFTFFKLYGKNYFKNYILINGLLLILLVVVIMFGFGEIFSQIFSSNLAGQSYYFESYFQENFGMLIATGILTFILYLALMIINYLYPVFYMKRISQGETKIGTDQILGDFKNNLGKIFILCLGVVFIIIPLMFVVLGISAFLMFIIIGFFLFLFFIPVIFNVLNFLMFDYFNTKRGFFESLSYAIRAQFSYPNGREKSPFWKYWGATVIVILILYVISTIFSFIPMLYFQGAILTTPTDGNFEQNPFEGTAGIIFFIISGISTIVSLFLANLLYVNTGLMYYDSRTDLHQKVGLAEIETIGINE